MKRQFSKAWRSCGWTILAVTVSALVFYNAAALFQASGLRSNISDLNARNSDLERLIATSKEWGRQVAEVYRHSQHEDRQLRDKLQTCTSREDFAVQSGPRIAWSELRGGGGTEARIGLYLPAGRHRLQYAACDVANMRVREEHANLSGTSRYTVTKGSGQDRQEFQTGHVSKLAGIAGYEFESTPQIYEIVLMPAPEKPLRMEIIGQDGATRDCSLPLNFRPNEFRTTMTKKAWAYPSEVKLERDSLTSGGKLFLPPVTDLAVITVREKKTRREADLRLWISSDSPACMSALEIAAKYPSLAGWERGSIPFNNDMYSEAADREFTRLFAPYDGSDRLFLRREVVK